MEQLVTFLNFDEEIQITQKHILLGHGFPRDCYIAGKHLKAPRDSPDEVIESHMWFIPRNRSRNTPAKAIQVTEGGSFWITIRFEGKVERADIKYSGVSDDLTIDTTFSIFTKRDLPVHATLTIMQCDNAQTFFTLFCHYEGSMEDYIQDMLTTGTNVGRLPIIKDLWTYITDIHNKGPVIDLRHLTDHFESLHTRLLSLENKI